MKNFLLSGCLFIVLSCTETASPGSQKNVALTRPPFNDTTAAIFSQVSYCPDPQAQLDKQLPGWKVVWNPAPVGGNYAFVATDDEKYAVAFRGSLLSFTEDAFSNWVYHDLNVAVQDKWPYCGNEKARVSQGAYIAWQNLEKMKDKNTGSTLWSFLSEKVKKDKPLFLTGHSLGGCMAITYASCLWSKFNEAGKARSNIYVTTFASPATGNRYFAEDFDKKFPAAIRFENTNDIVAKFPCTDKIKKLGGLFTGGPAASEVSIGYRNLSTRLTAAFTVISTALDLLEFTGDFSGYAQTCGEGRQITIDLSGKYKTNTAGDWFAEAGYQHSMERYAGAIGAPVVKCD